MGDVYRARDTRLDRTVAIKVSKDQFSERFDREARAVAALNSPHICQLYDVGPNYLVMEFVDGTPLGRADSAERLLDIASQIAEGLTAAHAAGIVHRDLKPANILITPGGRVKILDFGLATAVPKTSTASDVTAAAVLTHAGMTVGTAAYMSPEPARGHSVDARSDLWALGVILYELLGGAAPFHAPDTRRLEQQIRAGYARRPLPASCPVGLQAIVARLLAPDVSRRYPAATAVHDDLVLASVGRPTAAEAAGFPACLDEAPTRRTMVPVVDVVDDPERTRRTLEQPADASPSAAAVPAAARPAVHPPRRPYRSHPVRTLLLLAALFLACNEVAVGFRAGRLGAAAATRDLDGLQDVWGQYDALSRRSYLRLGIVGLERTMTSRVQALADQVIANYRTSLPTVRERQWQIARDNLQRALVLAPANRFLKAELRYCEGHLHRIGGEAELARRRTDTASQQFTEAVSAFREAAELRRDWPDPFLGLARVFIYGLGDIDRATDAIREAKRLGYTPGDRETAQFADGYRARGDSLWRTARQLVDLPQEQEYLQRATEAYKQAHDLYERIPAFPGVAANLRRVTRAMEQLAERAQERAAIEGLTDPWR